MGKCAQVATSWYAPIAFASISENIKCVFRDAMWRLEI